MKQDKEIKFLNTDDFEWPRQLNTSLRDEKIITYLKDSIQSNLQQALDNAARLRDLIPRAKCLRWYVLLFREDFVLLGWSEQSFVLQGPSPYTDTSAVDLAESTVAAAEKDGMPEKVWDGILALFYDFLEAYLRKWGIEGVEYFGETTESYYHL